MKALVLCKFLPHLKQKEQHSMVGSAGEFGLSKCLYNVTALVRLVYRLSGYIYAVLQKRFFQSNRQTPPSALIS